jgi:glycosyltransferase involved in cell wall biosynthesis
MKFDRTGGNQDLFIPFTFSRNFPMIKIAFIAPYPAAAALPDQYLKARVRRAAKQQHPAPWVRSLCRELAQRKGIKLEVFSHSRSITRLHRAQKDGIHYTFVPKYEPGRLDPYHFHIPARLQVLPLVKRFDADIVHGFGTEGDRGFLAVSQKKPSVVFIQGIQEKLAPYLNVPGLNMRIRILLERHVVRRANGVIAETEFARRWVKDLRPEARVKVIPHAYTESFFAAHPDFKRRRILCIGALNRTKGCTTVLEAFFSGFKRNPGLFKEAELLFLGGGPLENSLKCRVEEIGLREQVRFGGRVAHEKILKEMEKACMLAIGSRMDTSPNVITEAHAVGIPVVGTNAGGIPEMIENGHDGFVVPVDDIDAMSRCMTFFLEDLGRCREMGRYGRDKVIRLNDPSRVADAHIEFYQDLLARNFNKTD